MRAGGNKISDGDLRALLPELRTFALRLTREAAAADDLVQNCLERAISRWASRRPDGNLRAWLFTILYRQFLAERRKSKRFLSLLEFLAGTTDRASISEAPAMARFGLDALDKLSDDQRTLLLLVSVEGLSYQEAAEVLDIPIGTVMSRLSRARAAFHQAVEGKTSTSAIKVVS